MWPNQYQEELTFEDIQRIKAEKQQRRKLYVLIALGGVIIMIIIAAVVLNLRKNALGPSIDSAAAQITIQEQGGVYPTTVTVKQGETVIWSNQSATSRIIVSDNYGQNGVFTFKSKRAFSRQQAYYVTFDTPGTYGYHDQANPDKYKGTIVVQPR